MHKRSAIALCLIVFGGLLLTRCINAGKEKEEEALHHQKRSFSQFAGSASCASCHKKIYDSHLNTAHHLSSRPADASSIRGSFEEGKNTFSFSERTIIRMEKRDSGFYQVAYTDAVERALHRFDIVIGSGTKGQTSVYWHENRLYQLPISYFTAADHWSNSPGYPMMAVFNRPITARCLECHSTFINSISPDGFEPEAFDPGTMIYGIDCEKCHGPAARHVEYQQEHKEDSIGRFIINFRNFSRQQELEACAICHGGRLQKLKPSFQFLPGDKLSDFFITDTTPPNLAVIDLHGNQYGLLRASKCFRMSDQLTCTTCHNPHEKEKGQLALYSQRCNSCHNSSAQGNKKLCGMTATLGPSIQNNCIDCHMPARPSRAIAVQLPGVSSPVSAYVRSHFISVYPEETNKFLPMGKAHPGK